MLYLALDQSREHSFAKVGYTQDRHKGNHNSRIAAYRTHSPTVVIREFRAGDKQTENIFHNRLLSREGSYRTGTEWVRVSEQFFKELQERGFGAF